MEEEKNQNFCCHGHFGKEKSCVGKAFVVFLVVASLSCLAWGWATFKKASVPVPGAPSISVSGEGKVMVKPDLAKINFSVISQGAEYAEIQKDSDTKMSQAVAFLKESGVEEKDIKTISYDLSPQYDYSWCRQPEQQSYYVECPPKITGYQLVQEVEAKIRDLAKAGEIVSALPEKGINKIGSLLFTVDDPAQYQAEARAKAIADARKKAGVISGESGISLGGIVSFSEGGYYPPLYKTMATDREWGIGGGASSAAPLEAGSQEITVNVIIGYEIK